MNIPDWVWVVICLTLLLLGLQLGVALGRTGETARHGKGVHIDNDERPRATPQPRVDWGSINLDLSAPAKDKSHDQQGG
jgi:hypothetical protein